MTTEAHGRPTDTRRVTTGVTTLEAIVDDEHGTAPVDVFRLGEIDGQAGASRSIRKASTTAGVGLLLMSVLSAFGYLVAVKGLAVPGNAARTAKNLANHEGLFRFGIVSLYLGV